MSVQWVNLVMGQYTGAFLWVSLSQGALKTSSEVWPRGWARLKNPSGSQPTGWAEQTDLSGGQRPLGLALFPGSIISVRPGSCKVWYWVTAAQTRLRHWTATVMKRKVEFAQKIIEQGCQTNFTSWAPCSPLWSYVGQTPISVRVKFKYTFNLCKILI